MATVVETTLHTGRQRSWGWEIPTTFVDDDGNEHNQVLLFREGEPFQADIDAMVAFWVGKIEAAGEEVEIEPEI